MIDRIVSRKTKKKRKRRKKMKSNVNFAKCEIFKVRVRQVGWISGRCKSNLSNIEDTCTKRYETCEKKNVGQNKERKDDKKKGGREIERSRTKDLDLLAVLETC